MLEWNLPPLRFRSVGAPGFYLNWLRPALFGGAASDIDQPDELRVTRTVSTVGAQLDFKLVLFSNLQLDALGGLRRRAFEDGGETRPTRS